MGVRSGELSVYSVGVGAALVTIALVIVIPVSVMISGGVVAALIGTMLGREADARHQGSELIDLNT